MAFHRMDTEDFYSRTHGGCSEYALRSGFFVAGHQVMAKVSGSESCTDPDLVVVYARSERGVL